jgi:uncharacterized protein (TIGR00255 family)
MTGYGAGEAAADGHVVRATVTSVNRKQLDIRCNMPRELIELEHSLRKAVKASVSRGMVTVAIEYSPPPAGAAQVVVNKPLLRELVHELAEVRLELEVEPATLGELLRVDGVVRVEAPALSTEVVGALVDDALGKALAAHSDSRNREGAHLRADLDARHGVLATLVGKLHQQAPDAIENYRKKLFQRISEISDSIQLDDERLAKEVVLYADRSDISEELTRLYGHLEHMAQLFETDEPVGRKLDFLIQELLREINTVGSKSACGDIRSTVVDFKTELERIREQVQNLE